MQAAERTRRPGRLRLAGIIGLAGPIIFTLGWIVGGTLTPGYSHVSHTISHIAAIGAPYALVQQAGFMALALSVAVLGVAMHRSIEGGRSIIGPALVVVAAVGMVLTAIFQEDPVGTVEQSIWSVLHRATAMVFFGGMIAAAFAFIRRLRRDPAWRGLATFSLLSGLASLGLFVVYGFLVADLHPLTGLAQRAFAFSIMVWVVVMSVRLLRVTSWSSRSLQLRQSP